MKLHLPVSLLKSVLTIGLVATCFSLGSGAAWAEPQNLTLTNKTIGWNTVVGNMAFTDENGQASAFATGDNVTFAGSGTKATLMEDISAGVLTFDTGCHAYLTHGNHSLSADRIVLKGTLENKDNRAMHIGTGNTLELAGGGLVNTDLTLGTGTLVHSGSVNLNDPNGYGLPVSALYLSGGTKLELSSYGNGSTYNLFTNIGTDAAALNVYDASGNRLDLTTARSVSEFFDTSAPGCGYWANAQLQAVWSEQDNSYTLQLVRYSEITTPYPAVLVRNSTDIIGNVSVNKRAYRLQRDQNVSFFASHLAANLYFTSDSADSPSGLTIFATMNPDSSGMTIGDRLEFARLKHLSVSCDTRNTDYEYGKSFFSGYEYSYLGITHNGDVKIEKNITKSSGAAIKLGDYASVDITANWSVSVSEHAAISNKYNIFNGGAIYAKSINISDNQSVNLSNNSIIQPYSGFSSGGAISASKYGSINLNNNGSLNILNNYVSGNLTFGGALHAYGTSDAYGNGIYICNNRSALISNNGAEILYGSIESCGGAIYVYDTELRIHENETLSFTGNYLKTEDWSSNAHLHGGAIHSEESIFSLSYNDSVVFEGNYIDSAGSPGYGGAICSDGSGVISLSGNRELIFRNNRVNVYDVSRYEYYAHGGAIYTGSNHTFVIDGNGSVIFEKNAEINQWKYRLRSIWVDGSSVRFRTWDNQSIEFYDSIYVASGSSLDLNSQNGTGDILFSGLYTEEHLKEVKGSAGTAEEILNSRTSEVYTMTTLYGGRLRVEDGAVYKGHGINVVANTGATVRVKDAALNHLGYDLTFNDGSTFELIGSCEVKAQTVNMASGSNLYWEVPKSPDVQILHADLNLNGNLTVALGDNAGSLGENTILLCVAGDLYGDNTSHTAGDFTWVGNLLVYGYNESTFNQYNGSLTIDQRQESGVFYHHYEELSLSQLSGYDKGSVVCSNNAELAFIGYNKLVNITGNSASGEDVYGGAISETFISVINNEKVTISGNKTSAVDNNAFSFGGAIYAENRGRLSLKNNGELSFTDNTVLASSNVGDGHSFVKGGAICADAGSHIILSDNGVVSFVGNKIEVTQGYTQELYGGALYSDGDVSIRNNGSVTFRKNAEVNLGTYHLCSLHVGGADTHISFSAGEGQHISFYDSLHISAGATVDFNAAYNNQAQTGDIIFSAATVEDDLLALKGTAGTEEEILNSRTTEVYAMTNLYGGRLRVEDGAIYQGQGITVAADSAATVRVKDATLSHSGYDLIFNRGTHLELQGTNTLIGNVQLSEGSALSFVQDATQNTVTNATLTGNLTCAAGTVVNLAGFENVDGVHRLLDYDGATVENWDAEHITISAGDRQLGLHHMQWANGDLYYLAKVNWNGSEGNCVWNTASDNRNWGNNDTAFYYGETLDVVFGAEAYKNVSLEGDLSVRNMEVSAVYEITAPEATTLTVQQNLLLTQGADLTLEANAKLHTLDNAGHLQVAGRLDTAAEIFNGGNITVGGAWNAQADVNAAAVSVDGAFSVNGSLTAASLQAAQVDAANLKLTDATASNLISGDVTLTQSADVAGALQVTGSVTASSLNAGSLKAADLTLTGTDSDSVVSGAVEVTNGANISGSLTAASLQAAQVDAAKLILTDAAASNIISGNVTITQAADIAGALQVTGSVTANSLNAGSLKSADLTLTGTDSDSVVSGAVEVTNSVDFAGHLTAASLQAAELNGCNLTLTDATASNIISGNATITQAADIAGALQVDGTVMAASLNAAGLSAYALKLTDAEAVNTIAGDADITTTARVAGCLDVGGVLSVITLQAGSLRAESLNLKNTGASLILTDSDGESRIGSGFAHGGDLLVSGGISFEGDVSVVAAEVGKQLDVNGALTAATLNAGSLAADSLKVTEAGCTHFIGGAAAVTHAVDVAGDLSVRRALSAGSVSTGRLSAGSLQSGNVTVDSLWLTLNGAQNRITGSATVTDAVNVAGSLEVSGALQAASLQSGSLAADSLNLTDAAANNLIHGGVSVDNEIAVAGSLSVDGVLSAASLQAGRLTATALSLTESSADNEILGAVSVTNAAEIAGSLFVHGGLSAGSLVSGALTADSLWLTIDAADNRINGAATITGAVNVAGNLDIDGALQAASLQAGSLKVDSLCLTDAGAYNLIRGNAAISGAVNVAGGLSVDGALSTAHLQAGSLMAGDVSFTGENVAHSVAGDMTAKSVSLASGSTLDVGGKLSLQQGSASNVEQGAALSASSLVLDGAAAKLTNAGTMNLTNGATVNSGHLQNLGHISNITLVGGTVSGNGTFAGLTMSGGTLVVGNSPGLQTYTADLVATGGTIEFSVAGTDAATSSDAGWESGTHSLIALSGCKLSLDDVSITVAFGGEMSTLEDGTYDLVLFTDVGNITDFNAEALTKLAENTAFILSTEEGAVTNNITVMPEITNTYYTVEDNNIVLNFTVSAAAVPEPATTTLSLLALAGLAARRRRK